MNPDKLKVLIYQLRLQYLLWILHEDVLDNKFQVYISYTIGLCQVYVTKHFY